VAKRRPAPRKVIDPATHARLLAIGPYEFGSGPGSWSIRFDLTLKAAGMPDFGMSWSAIGPGSKLPPPDEALFALWHRYRAAHSGLCGEYRRVLLGLLSRSPFGGQYTNRMWRAERRRPPSERDMSGVVTGATLHFEQRRLRGESVTTYIGQVEFHVYWDEHGVTVGLQESDGAVVVVGG
jgi:hypothetical protein